MAEQLGVPPVLGPDGTKRRLIDALAGAGAAPGLVHIAAHARLNPEDGTAELVLGGGDARSDADRFLTAADLRGARLSSALVVLSCCASGLGGLRPGDELTGLVRSFLTSGASSVIVSQWSVDDLSTSLLMRHFYRRLQETRGDGSPWTLAHALRAAVVHLRSLTRQQLAESASGRSADGLTAREPSTARMLRVDAAALGSADRFPAARAALATSTDPLLRDAALEAEERQETLAAVVEGSGDAGHPFQHPYYWAPFILVGDWRLSTGGLRTGGRAPEADTTL
ncbi:CHAT domain-containing protein [Streptomyces cyaneofuscatus]